MIDIFSDQTLYERVIFALTGQFYHRAAGSAAALVLRRRPPTIQKKRAQRIRASMPPEFWHYYMAEERGVVRGVARATPIFQILFHKTVSPQILRLSMPQTIETFSTYSYNNL